MKTRGKQYRDLAPKKPPKKQPKSVVVDHEDAVEKDTLDAPYTLTLFRTTPAIPTPLKPLKIKR